MRFGFAALAVLSSFLISACDSGSVPNGWERNDYIAYLMFSDLFRGIGEDSSKGGPQIVCIANNIERGNAELHDPSAKLMESLRAFNEQANAKLELRLASECEAREPSKVVVERSTGREAVGIMAGGGPGPIPASGANDPKHASASYSLSWHIAPLSGGGYIYLVDESKAPLIVTRTKGMWVE